METLLIILALVCAIVGLLGSVLPALPGAPISYVGWLLLLPCEGVEISTASLWIYGIFLAIVSILDYVAPGSMAGLIAGLFFFPPIGLIIGPFVGAFIGEMMESHSRGKALKVALMSFVGFVLTTGMKIVYSGVLLFAICAKAIQLIF